MNKFQDILASLIVDYPQQCLWLSIASLLSNSVPSRQARCEQIYEKVKSEDINGMRILVDDFVNFARLLEQMANHKIWGPRRISMAENYSELFSFFDSNPIGKNKIINNVVEPE